MCGIIGYVGGGGNAAHIVYEGLERLEYRGYDSAGIAVLGNNGRINIVKRQGRVQKLKPFIYGLEGSLGIGHTRWATHGVPSDSNAHPHSAGKITVVHNGIIENYAELKRSLEEEGEIFFSETDSEVAAKLINKNFKGDLLRAVADTAKVLKGSYALIAMREGYPCLAVAKMKSSLILGCGNGENYCASDQPALASVCADIIVLEDGDFALISSDNISVYDGSLNKIERTRIKNNAVSANMDLNGYPHYMLKEMHEIPATLKNTVSAFYESAAELKSALAGIDRVIFTGCGTAYHAGLLGKRYFENFARIPSEAETAGEFRYKNPVITPSTAVFAISQSGETADTVEAARLALSLGAKVIAVTNSPHSALTRLASVVIPVEAGAEICVAATKSYVGQIAALYLAALAFAGYEKSSDFAQKIYKIPDVCADILKNIDVAHIARTCAKARVVYFLGKDLDYSVALEGSLKLKEVSYIAGEGYPSGELKHGTLALVDGDSVSIILITDPLLSDKSQNAAEQIISRGGKTVIITNVGTVAEKFAGRSTILRIPECDSLLSPFLTAVAVQEIAYRTAVIMGRDPDKPRNLAKSVTVE